MVWELARWRGLLGVLVRRDLVLRHNRSALGVFWSFLNPLLMSVVFLVVFSQLFRFSTGGTPYIVYVLSGTVLMTTFGTAVMAAATSVVGSAPVLARIRAPAAAFALAASAATVATSLAGVAVLLGVQLVTGAGIAAAAPLAVLPIASAGMFAGGLGLALATPAVRFYDVVEFLRIVLQVLVFITPTFYPVSIVPDGFRWIIEANPMTHYLDVFRSVLYGADDPGTLSWLLVLFLGPAAMFAGFALFARGWARIVPWL